MYSVSSVRSTLLSTQYWVYCVLSIQCTQYFTEYAVHYSWGLPLCGSRPLPWAPRGPGPGRAPGGGPGVSGVGAPGRAGPRVLEGLPQRPRAPCDAPWTPAALEPGGPPWPLQGLQRLDPDRLGAPRLVLLRGRPGPPSPQRPRPSRTTCRSRAGRWGPGLGGLLSCGMIRFIRGSRSHQRV